MSDVESPLEGLDEVPWSELEHAYGAADDVPALIRDLLSDDPERRKKSRYWLGGNIIHQGSIYSATAPAVPFLIRLAVSPDTPDRAWIVRYLADLALSQPNEWLSDGFDLNQPRMQGYFDGDGAEPYRNAYEAVEAGLGELLGLLADDDPAVRANAAFTTAFFARKKDAVRRALEPALDGETDPDALGSMLLALTINDCYQGDTAGREIIRRYLDTPMPLRLVAAIAASYGEVADPAALPVLEAGLLDESILDGRPGLVWNDGNLGAMALDAVFRQIPLDERNETGGPGVTAAQNIFFALMERVDVDSSDAAVSMAHSAMRPLFRTVTPTPPPAEGWTLDTLRPTLRRFAEAVVHRPFLCSGGLLDAFRENGLPDELPELQEFLHMRVASPLDVELVIDGETRTAAAWLGAADEADAWVEAVAARDDAIAIAFHLATRGRGQQVGQIGTMSFTMTPADGEAESVTLQERLVDAAVDRDADAAYAAALELANAHATKGPPRTYGRNVQVHTAALTLLARIAARVARATGREPDPVFDVMTEAQLGHSASWTKLAPYYQVLSPERRAAFFLGLAERGWKKTWPDNFGISIGDVFDDVVELLPPEARATLLMDTAESDADAAMRSLARYHLPEVLEVVARSKAASIEGMRNWAAEDMGRQTRDDAAAIGRLGPWVYPVMQRLAEDDELGSPLFEAAMNAADSASQVGNALRDGAVVTRDERGLMPLADARRMVENTGVYRKGEGEMINGTHVLESDRMYAALLSLEDADEFVRHAKRIEWTFHVRGMENTALLERYGDGILPWIESHIDDDGILHNTPWCIVPCLLGIESQQALGVVLRVRGIDGLSQGTEELELPRRWIARHPNGYGMLASLADGGDQNAVTLLVDRAKALGAPVYDAVSDALGVEVADRIATTLGLPKSILPPAVAEILLAAPIDDEPRGPLWSIAELDDAAADYDLPLWDNANFTTAAMRITGFASRHGDVLVIETIRSWPGAGEYCTYYADAYGPGAETRSACANLIDAGELETVQIADNAHVDGITDQINIWRDDHNVVIPQPLPFEHHVLEVKRALLNMKGETRTATYRLPQSFASADPEQLADISPMEGLLVQLCARYADAMFPFTRDLRTALGVPDGAVELFQFDSFEYVPAGEPASASVDLLAMVEALRTRRRIGSLPSKRPNSRPEHWMPELSDLRSFQGPNPWAAGDGPLDPPPIEDGHGASPYWSMLLERGWPHGVMLMHSPDYNAPGMAEQTIPYLVQQPGVVMTVFWPRRTACLFARVCGRAEVEWSMDDPGVAAAMSDDAFLFEDEATELIGAFARRSWSPPAHVGAELIGIVEATCGGAVTVAGLAAALASLDDSAWADDHPALAAAVFEAGFVLRRLPAGAAEAHAALASCYAETRTNDVGRALDLVLHGRAGAERSARRDADYAHVLDDRAWAAERICDAQTPAAPFDAALVPLAGEALLARLADRIDDEDNPSRLATQLAALGAPRAVALLLAMFHQHEALRPQIVSAMLDRPDVKDELEHALRGAHPDAARVLLGELQAKEDREYEERYGSDDEDDEDDEDWDDDDEEDDDDDVEDDDDEEDE